MRVWIVLFVMVGLMATRLAPLCQVTAAAQRASAADPCLQSLSPAQAAHANAAEVGALLPLASLAVLVAFPIVARLFSRTRLAPTGYAPQLYPPPPR